VSDDRAVSTLIWECTAGQFVWRYDFDETIHILEGAVTISAPGEPERRLLPGDTVHFSRGAIATWTVDVHVRKIAFCRRAPPRTIAMVMRVARGLVRRAKAWLRFWPLARPTRRHEAASLSPASPVLVSASPNQGMDGRCARAETAERQSGAALCLVGSPRAFDRVRRPPDRERIG